MPKLQRGLGGADRDVGELRGVGIRVDGAVAVDQDAVGQAHEEDARDDRHAFACLDDLEGRPDRVRGRVRRRRTPSRRRPRVRPSSCRSSSTSATTSNAWSSVMPRACAARRSAPRTRPGAATSAGRRPPRRRGRRRQPSRGPRISSGSPRIVRSTTPRRSRISAARRTRSSSPSGQDDVAALGLRALDQLVLEHQRRHPGGPVERDAPAELARCRRPTRSAERRGDLALVVRAAAAGRATGPPAAVDMHGLRGLEHRERRTLEQAAHRVARVDTRR